MSSVWCWWVSDVSLVLHRCVIGTTSMDHRCGIQEAIITSTYPNASSQRSVARVNLGTAAVVRPMQDTTRMIYKAVLISLPHTLVLDIRLVLHIQSNNRGLWDLAAPVDSLSATSTRWSTCWLNKCLLISAHKHTICFHWNLHGDFINSVPFMV